MAEIFISYRRDDTGFLCERVTARLSARFGAKRVFRDTSAIIVGSSWAQVLHTALQDSYVVIALIGPGWLAARDAQGNQRLFDPHDFVRMELAAALAQRKRIIPVLANGARMPQPHELPPDLAALAQIPPIFLRPDPWFESDMWAIMQAVAPGAQRRIPHPVIAICGGVGLLSVLLTTYGVPALLLFLLYLPGQLALLLGLALILLLSAQTREWLWLTMAAALFAPLLMTVVWSVELYLLLLPALPTNTLLIAMEFFAQMLAAVLALAFGFFGPRRFPHTQTDLERLHTWRWVIGASAGIASALMAAALIGALFHLTVVKALFYSIELPLLAVTLLGVGVAFVGSLVRSRRWWWPASIAVTGALLLAGFWLSINTRLSSTVRVSAIIIGAACVICALDAFALCSDLPELRERSETRLALSMPSHPAADSGAS